MNRLLNSFKYALKGFSFFINEKGNMRIHCIAAMLVVIAGIYFDINKHEWLILLICMAMVLSAEAMNTAVEKLTDIVSPSHTDPAGKVKDIAAAAVLILAFASLIAAVIIFLPKIILMLS